MKISQLLLIALLSCSVSFTTVAKDDKGKGNSKKSEKSVGKNGAKHEDSDAKRDHKPESHAHGKSTISQRERDILHDYVQSCHAAPGRTLPPGLAKKVARGKELPPGWQKKMTVGAICPPDIYKISVPLPKDLVIKLPPPPLGTITVAVEGKIVRLLEKTKEILDIIDLPTPAPKRR